MNTTPTPAPHISMSSHAIRGLDDRDLALLLLLLLLLVAACANQANFLAHLAAGHYDHNTAIRSGYDHDRRAATDDARRLQHIAETLRHRLPQLG